MESTHYERKVGSNMKIQWIVVASQRRVRILTRSNDRKYRLVRTLINPLGRTRDRDLVRHQAGTIERRGGGNNFGFSRPVARQSPHENAAIDFSKKVSSFLEKERDKNSFESLMIVAEPHFLGKLKSAMNSNLLRLVEDWVDRDFDKVSEHELPNHLNQK